MSSPGSGKTTLLEETIRRLKAKRSIYVIEGDQQTSNDADRIAALEIPVFQVNTGTGCHLEADMVNHAVKHLNPKEGAILFIENVGNLVCPAMFDLGESKKVVIVSTTEGDDKPLKYPHIFQEADICVINKIDLPAARPEEVKHEIEDVIGLPAMDAPEISAKNGINIHAVLEMIVNDVPAPKGDREAPLQCLIFDSQYDSYRGAIVYMRVVNGVVKPGMDIKMMSTGAVYKVVEVGYLHPLGMRPSDALGAGEVGYLTASIKTVSDTRVGDTITSVENPSPEALPGYKEAQPMVFSGVYPADGSKYQDLRDALEKLKLNDASMSYTQENSIALGFGFRCGFLGLLHMEIILERLEREYNLDLITTAPNVVYQITKTDGTEVEVYTPLNYPDPAEIAEAREPYAKVNLITPPEYVGAIMDLCTNRRGEFKDMKYLDTTRVELHYSMPLNEIIYDFFDALKSRTRGYGSLDYELEGYRPSKLVKLDILLNGEIVDALSFILFADNAYARARKICEKLKENIPRQMFEIPVQAAVGGKIIARETIKALRKDVLAKCYGGDITRKKKLLEKQKEGKKRMRTFGTVAVPSEAFMAVLKLDEE